MKYILFCLLVLSLLNWTSCTKENELAKSVYTPDPELTDLPAYSEWGYNTFGAYYDRNPFVFMDKMTPLKVINSSNHADFLFTGKLGGYSSYYDDYYFNYSYDKMELKFVFGDKYFNQYTDLLTLNNTHIDLLNSLNKVVLEYNNTIDTLEIISGEIYFKRAQNLKVDKKPVEVILSGYFELKAILKSKPITISEGRFDVGINDNNFYKY